MSSQQVIDQECPICMDTIEGLCNRVVTECGHAFHCSCLMQNAVHNGFGCPYCRTKMAEEPAEEDDDDVFSTEENTEFEDNLLTSFRMFHQQINGEEVEEEPDDDWVSVASDEDEDEEPMPDAAYITQKLNERGITMEDLVKNVLFQEHSNWGSRFGEYERRSSEVYGQFRAIITQFNPLETTPTEPVITPVITTNSIPMSIPLVAETKTVKSQSRRREFMCHV